MNQTNYEGPPAAVSEPFISALVDEFYARIRADEQLGPIFAERIGGDWAPHLARMKSFWSSVALRTGTYSGQPVPIHKRISELEPEHFSRWLDLFERTLRDLSPDERVAVFFMEKANRIASSLKLAIWGLGRSRSPKLNIVG